MYIDVCTRMCARTYVHTDTGALAHIFLSLRLRTPHKVLTLRAADAAEASCVLGGPSAGDSLSCPRTAAGAPRKQQLTAHPLNVKPAIRTADTLGLSTSGGGDTVLQSRAVAGPVYLPLRHSYLHRNSQKIQCVHHLITVVLVTHKPL